MTQPPFEPAGTPPATDPAPAEPVPTLAPPAQLDRGLAVNVGLDGSTTYHQQAPATVPDVTAGDGSIDPGTAGDVTVAP